MPGLVLPILVAMLPVTGEPLRNDTAQTSVSDQRLARVWDLPVPQARTREMPRLPNNIVWSGEFAGTPCTIAADIPSGGFKLNVTMRF